MKLMPRSMARRTMRMTRCLVDLEAAEVPAAEADGGDALAGSAEFALRNGGVGTLGIRHRTLIQGTVNAILRTTAGCNACAGR